MPKYRAKETKLNDYSSQLQYRTIQNIGIITPRRARSNVQPAIYKTGVSSSFKDVAGIPICTLSSLDTDSSHLLLQLRD